MYPNSGMGPFSWDIVQEQTCGNCEKIFYKIAPLENCVVCGKAICNDCNKHGLCSEHFKELPERLKKGLIRIDKIDSQKDGILKTGVIIAILNLILGFVALALFLNEYALIGILLILFGMILLGLALLNKFIFQEEIDEIKKIYIQKRIPNNPE